MSITFSDLCAGIGGFRLGLENIGLRCVYSCEIDQDCTVSYNKNFNDDIRPTDLLDVKESDLVDFNVLCAGFPCQPFSIAGKQGGVADERAQILPKILAICDHKRPDVVFLENVANFLRHDGGKVFADAVSQLNRLGYRVFHKILDSAFFGVPQSRPRLYIVAFHERTAVDTFDFPKEAKSSTPFRPFIAKGDFSIPITKRWDEYIDYYSGRKSLADLSFQPPKTRLVLERADKGIDLSSCIFQMRSSGIRAISLDRPLPTLAVSISGGGAMIPVYSGERRHLSLLELRRVMGFPDDFCFPVSRTSAIKQLANAVCPPVIQSIGKQIMQALTTPDKAVGQICLPLSQRSSLFSQEMLERI